jgi:hypothetical protein
MEGKQVKGYMNPRVALLNIQAVLMTTVPTNAEQEHRLSIAKSSLRYLKNWGTPPFTEL